MISLYTKAASELIRAVEGKPLAEKIEEDILTLYQKAKEAIFDTLGKGLRTKKGYTSLIRDIRETLRIHMGKLKRFLDWKYGQLSSYKILWEYERAGYERYRIISNPEREDCDFCISMAGEEFSITEAEVGINLPPFHPNCDCYVAALDEGGHVVKEDSYSLSENEAGYIAMLMTNPFSLDLETALKVLKGMKETGGNVTDEQFNSWGMTKAPEKAYAALQYILMEIGMTVEAADYRESSERLSNAVTMAIGLLVSAGYSVAGRSQRLSEKLEMGNPNNVKVNQGQQDKHIPGTNNYKQSIESGVNRSILNEDPQRLLDEYAGTGTSIGQNKEWVDFEKNIGQFYDINTGTYVDTAKGIIHYNSNGGAHIVPSNPTGIR